MGGALGALRVIGEGHRLQLPYRGGPALSARGKHKRHLQFPDGSQCETADNDAVDAIFATLPSEAPGRLIHLWESRYGYALLALALTAAALWAGINLRHSGAGEAGGVGPASLDRDRDRSRRARRTRPGSAHALEAPARTTGKDAGAVCENDLRHRGADGYRLELRSSKRLGANAFALPSGEVVVTDQLVELAKKDDELVAVLAHEIGHLRQRHGLRRLLQDSATVLLIAAVTGDLTSIVSLASALPAILLQAKYSRDFEREADEFALDYMKRHDVPPESFGAILLRMEARRGAAADIPDYLSTHPATRERAERSRVAR